MTGDFPDAAWGCTLAAAIDEDRYRVFVDLAHDTCDGDPEEAAALFVLIGSDMRSAATFLRRFRREYGDA